MRFFICTSLQERNIYVHEVYNMNVTDVWSRNNKEERKEHRLDTTVKKYQNQDVRKMCK